MDYVQLEKDVKGLHARADICNDRLDKLDLQVIEMNKKVDKILALLIGNDLDKSDVGFIGVAIENKKRIGRLEMFKNRFVWILIGVSLGAGYGLREFVKNVLGK